VRYFLPLEAENVSASSGFFQRDAMEMHRAVPQARAKRIWFRLGTGRPPAEPTLEDKLIPEHVLRDLLELASAWGAHQGSPRARMRRLEARLLQDYGYTVQLEQPARVDPVVDFLVSRREGHCEYFASALALLGRASGVPTRVVAGYRVAEYSQFGYYIVRRRHAHSWVEAYVGGRWQTYDPTPASELLASSPTTTPAWSAVWDALATGWEAADDWLEQRSAFEFSLTLLLLAGGFALARVLRDRRRKRLRLADPDTPLEGFVRLGESLTRKGISRSPQETLERFASRVQECDALPQERRQDVGDLIRTYATLRYAGRGDPSTIERQLVAAARSLG
jgi:hypothetical protein